MQKMDTQIYAYLICAINYFLFDQNLCKLVHKYFFCCHVSRWRMQQSMVCGRTLEHCSLSLSCLVSCFYRVTLNHCWLFHIIPPQGSLQITMLIYHTPLIWTGSELRMFLFRRNYAICIIRNVAKMIEGQKHMTLRQLGMFECARQLSKHATRVSWPHYN